MDQSRSRRVTTKEDLLALQVAVECNGDPISIGLKRGMSLRSIRRYRSRIAENPDIDAPLLKKVTGGDFSTKFDGEMLTFLIGRIEECPDLTLGQLNLKMQEGIPHKPHIVESTLWKHLDGALITLKKLHIVPAQRNSVSTKIKRRDYALEFMHIRDEQTFSPVFIDETGWSLLCRQSRGRAPMGVRANLIVPMGHCQHLNMCAAISPVIGWIYHQLYEQSFRKETFLQFVRSLLDFLNVSHPAIRFCFIADNARIHSPVDLNALFLLPEYSRHRFLFLPPYSPVLNPIENAFSCLKAHVKAELALRNNELLAIESMPRGTKGAAKMALLRELAQHSIPSVSAFECSHWYEHCCSYLGKCISMEDIVD